MNSTEKRKFIRVPFSSSEKINAICKCPDGNGGPVSLHIANISEGGLGLMANKNDIASIQQNDILILDKVVGNQNLSFMMNLELEVKWVLNSEHMTNIGFGCCFLNIPESFKDRIINFMNTMDYLKLQA